LRSPSKFRQTPLKASNSAIADSPYHFHDTRHEGITRLAAVLVVLELARAVGHRDLRMLQAYYNESAEDIAKQLK
jgi:integrase